VTYFQNYFHFVTDSAVNWYKAIDLATSLYTALRFIVKHNACFKLT